MRNVDLDPIGLDGLHLHVMERPPRGISLDHVLSARGVGRVRVGEAIHGMPIARRVERLGLGLGKGGGLSPRCGRCGIAIRHVSQPADARPESPVAAARAPCPTSASLDGKMVVSERVDSGEEAHEVSEENVEPVVPEVVPA